MDSDQVCTSHLSNIPPDKQQTYLCKQGHPTKRRKTQSTTFIPPEIRNSIYEHAALPNDVEPEKRTFITIAEDITIASSETAQSFYLDTISESGQSALFAKEIVQVAELTEEVLTLVMPKILFKFRTPCALRIFAETFAAHAMVCEVVPELHIELDFATNLDEEDLIKLGSWAECNLPHGRAIYMHNHVENWMSAIQLLPEITYVHLVFTYIWRDFRELRGLSKKFGLSKYRVTFQFPTPSIQHQENSFFEAQTMAAVKDLDVYEQAGLSDAKRAKLVKFGCRGFNRIRQRPTI